MDNILKFNNNNEYLEKRIRGVKRAYKIPNEIKGGIAVDVGSNVGAFVIVNHNIFNKILCIEPSIFNVKCIEYNLKLYNINHVDIIRSAVYSESNKVLKLKPHKADKNISGNASTIENPAWDSENYELVESIDLEKIYMLCSNKIEYLKIDCECAEYDFLINKDLSNINYLSIEIHIQLGKKKVNELLNYINKFFKIINSKGNGKTSHYENTYKNKLVE